jgi:hypothetical protein
MFFLQKSVKPLLEQWVVDDGIGITPTPAEAVVVKRVGYTLRARGG